MSVIATALKHMLAAGMPADAIVAAVEAMEAEMPAVIAVDPRDQKLAMQRDRQARYQERKRQKASDERQCPSEHVNDDAPDVRPHPLPSSPPAPPQLPTPAPECITTRARKDDGFDQFWDAYPRKVGKDAARRAYAAAVRRLDDPDAPAIILVGVGRSRSGWTDPQFIPHPTTWLNQGRYADEPPNPLVARSDHERPSHATGKFDRHQSNLERAVAGSEIAARLRTIEPESSF